MRGFYGTIFSKRLIPEIARFDDQQELHRHLEAASSGPRSAAVIFGFVAWVLAVVYLSRSGLAPLLGVPAWVVQAGIQPVAMLGGFYWLFNYGLRRPLQRRLREALREKGVPICLACGYDLRGQVEPRCPECDERFPPDLLRHHAEDE